MAESVVRHIVEPERRGPVEGEATVGFDRSLERRPGVPMDAAPSDAEGVAGRSIERQADDREHKLHRQALESPTRVFGAAQLDQGAAGRIRAAAYRIPEHRARHWMLLLFADRVEVAGDRLGGVLARPLEAAGARRAAERIRTRPVLALGVAIGGALLTRRLLR